MGKGKRNKHKNKACSQAPTAMNSENEMELSRAESHLDETTPSNGKSEAEPGKSSANKDVSVSENENNREPESKANAVAYSNKGLIQALEAAPAASCELVSRSLMLLEYTLLNDKDPQVRKRALEAYSELVAKEAQIALHEERSKRPGNFSNTGAVQNSSGRYGTMPEVGLMRNDLGTGSL